jgi:hypothetical protein
MAAPIFIAVFVSLLVLAIFLSSLHLIESIARAAKKFFT